MNGQQGINRAAIHRAAAKKAEEAAQRAAEGKTPNTREHYDAYWGTYNTAYCQEFTCLYKKQEEGEQL